MKTKTAPPPGPRKSRILIVEDHPVVSGGIAGLVQHEADLTVCGAADDAQGALEQVRELEPDVILLDISLKDGNGLELLKAIKEQRPEQKVLMLSMHDESLYAARALKAGAGGYVMKHEATATLILAIRQVLNGEIFLSAAMQKNLLRRNWRHNPDSELDPLETLSQREREVFRLVGQGKGVRQIASELGVSVKTIETHRAHILDKLNLRGSADLLRHAIELQKDLPQE